MIDSTLGRGKCTDFFGNQDLIYTEKQATAGAKKIEWKGDKKGTITISKIFFTPTNTPQFITLNSLSDPAKAIFTSYPNITSPSSIQLNNYLNSEDNDSLQSIFDAVSSQKMCISQNSSQTIQTWWNKDYLDKLIKEIAGANTKTEC
jgi:hypothetical protein